MIVNMLLLMWTFFKIGLFTFGGGYAMIPLIMSELTSKSFVTMSEMVDIIAVSQVTPGTFAINAATFSGVKAFGIFGGIFATMGVMLPSIILASLLARFYIAFKDNNILKNTMYVLRPVVLGLIAGAVVILIPTALLSAEEALGLSFFSRIDFYAVIIALMAIIAVVRCKISPIIVVFFSGIFGIVFYQIL